MASGLSNADVERQIKHMMAFIDQEANEKVEEIDAKAEEEFNIEKGRLVQQQRVKIMEIYDKKEKQIELQKKILNSNMLNEGRLEVLKKREELIHSILGEAQSRLGHITNNPGQYKSVLQRLLTQGLCQILEKEVIVKCREADQGLVKEVIQGAQSDYQRITKKEANLNLSRDFLPAACAGGIVLTTKNGQIIVENTLESRLDLMSSQMIPEIREQIFGKNPNRKFID